VHWRLDAQSLRGSFAPIAQLIGNSSSAVDRSIDIVQQKRHRCGAVRRVFNADQAPTLFSSSQKKKEAFFGCIPERAALSLGSFGKSTTTTTKLSEFFIALR
jgi:hypothetical protein